MLYSSQVLTPWFLKFLKPMLASTRGRPEPDRPADLLPEHLPALQRLHKRARWIAKGLREELAGDGRGTQIRVGYHAVPSLEPLHLL